MKQPVDRTTTRKQGKDQLEDSEGRVCCLQRVCELAGCKREISYGNGDVVPTVYYGTGAGRSSLSLSDDAQAWLGLTSNPVIIRLNNTDYIEFSDRSLLINAAQANDQLGLTFSQIADCLEWEYLGHYQSEAGQ